MRWTLNCSDLEAIVGICLFKVVTMVANSKISKSFNFFLKLQVFTIFENLEIFKICLQ